MKSTTCLILAVAAFCAPSVSFVCAKEASSAAEELTKSGQLVQKLESLHLVMYGKNWMPGSDKVKTKCFNLWYASKDSCLRMEEVFERCGYAYWHGSEDRTRMRREDADQ